MMTEIDALSASAPTNNDLIGYNIAEQLPNSMRAKSALWRQRVSSSDMPRETEARSTERFQNSSGERCEAFYQTLPLFWSRQTYRVDLGVFDWLSKICAQRRFEQTQVPAEFEDHFLGSVAGFAEKWRIFEGAVFAVPTSFADRGWKRKFAEIAGLEVNVGGRPNKSLLATEVYFDLYPNTHHDPEASETGSVTWNVALRAVIKKSGTDIGDSTFRNAIRANPRYKTRKDS